ncbi:hypothetical protein M501DRAFT_941657 [Patellaria atrata CBS 101060]|uniref:Uncharacterized protein n=1 Tax=Patellaria atrata CBS 101060 TaxID=1346257 RepID=A0A9P4VNJ1_9PEZI|nr:hypothetical protein M501DRAFT_941657 [Patellaria atrata CBS 101060]
MATISRSKEKQNINLTTIECYTAEFLQQHKHIWQEFFQFQREQKIEPWAKIIVHGVPIQPF